MNHQSRITEILIEAGRELEPHCRAFARHAASFYTGGADHDFHLDLKVGHTAEVLGLARALAAHEPRFSDPATARTLHLAALYHDIGRFRQYHEHGTFSDPKSCNHAVLGAKVLKQEGMLREETPAMRGAVLAAILTHNRYALPGGLAGHMAAVARALRDADKLDIMRVMAEHLAGDGPPDPVVVLDARISDEASQPVLDAVSARRLVRYEDLATTTDFKLLVCGWFYDLNYGWSRRKAAASPHIAALVAALPDTAPLQAFRDIYIRDLAAHA